MYWTTLALFFALCYGLGYLLTFSVKNADNFLERHLMRIGIGLGGFIALGYLLNLLRIPLDYKIFLFLIVLGILAANGYRYWKTKSLGIKKTTFSVNVYVLGMLILFAITFFMYHKGAFSYPYLENDDPWGHAVGAKFVAMEKTLFRPEGASIRYVDPYPPAYDLLMGVLNQTNDSIYWTLKFINALILSLSIIFFYFFAKELLSSSKKALFAAFALFAMPAFMSHFIWAIALTIPLMFVSFYCLERIREERSWAIPAAIVIGATLTISPSHSAYFALFLAIAVALKTILARRFLWNEYFASAGGIAISLSLWWIPAVARHGVKEALAGLGLQSASAALNVSGTGDRQYGLSDFMIAKGQNLINNPTGLGIIITLLLGFSLAYLYFKYRQSIKSNIKVILPLFLGLFSLFLFLLWRIYLKYPEKRTFEKLVPGSIPFMEFFGDQIFLILFFGVFLFLFITLAVASWKNKDFRDGHILISLGWLLLTFYAINAAPFAYRISPFRVWMLMAIPVAILVAEGISTLLSLIRESANAIASEKIALAAVFACALLLGFGIIKTSFAQKYEVNTAQWTPGGFWTSNEEIQGYLWMHQLLPPNTPIFTFSNGALLLAFDKYACPWCQDVRDFERNGFAKDAESIHSFLQSKRYQYLVIDGQAVKRFGANQTNAKIQELVESKKFTPAFQNSGMVVFAIS